MSMRAITFKVLRFDPASDSEPHHQEYALDVPEGTTVLEALLRIQAEQDRVAGQRGPRLRRSLRRRHRGGRGALPGDGRA